MSDFSDNKSELDEYGVWVKKPPVENEITDTPAEEPVVDASFIEQAAASDQVIEQDLAEFDIDSLAIDETEIAADDETSVSDFDPQETVIDESSTQDISEESFMTEETPVVEEPSVEDFMQTEAVPEQEESVPSQDEISLDDFSLDKLHEENKPMSFTPDESDVSGAQPETEPEEAAPSFEDGEIDLDSFMSDDSAPKADSTPDGDVDLSSFMDDSAPADGDVDLSAFMGGGDSPDFGNGDIDLEAFMGSEGFASDKQEQEEIEDADPLDIDLDFETTDVELQDAEASGDVSGIVTASTYPDMSETTEVEDFDALFDEIVDETPQEKKTPAPAPEPKQQTDDGSEEIDLSDFGFEDNPENQNPILGDSKEEQKVKAGPVDYEMNVDDEDPSESSGSTKAEVFEETTEENDEDDIQIDISQDSEKAIQKEQETDLSSPDDSFDIDSILNNVEDENGGTISFDGVPKHEEEVTDNQPMFQEQETEESVSGQTSESVDPSFDSEEISLDDFMGDEGFTDGGPGVTGPYNEDGTLIIREEKKPEAAAVDEPVVEETAVEEPAIEETTSAEPSFEEMVIDEPVVEETAVEEPAIEDDVIEEPVITEEIFEEPVVENTVIDEPEIGETFAAEPSVEEMVIEEPDVGETAIEEPVIEENAFEESTAIEEDAFDTLSSEEPEINVPVIEDFAIEEPVMEDTAPETEFIEPAAAVDNLETETVIEENVEEEQGEDFNESEMSDIMEEPELNTMEEENITEPDYSNISAFADKKPEYDMTGVTLTLEDFENIKEYPDPSSEPEAASTAEEPDAVEETAPQASVPSEEPETYSVFIKTESSAGKAEVTAVPEPEENDITTEEKAVQKTADSSEDKMDAFDASSVLSKISEELASLRSEISDLKSEFAEIKKNGVAQESEETESPFETSDTAAEDSVELPAPEDDTGFFNETDEDDTIALSGDELSNILSTAEFTSQTGENLDDGLKMDFDGENLEEPVFEDSAVEESDDSEEEISVPSVDDVLVESSSTDLMDNTITTAEDAETISDDVLTEDDIPSPTLESLDLPEYSDEQEELTEDNIEYLKNDNASEEDESLETGISEQPVEDVFTNWDAASEPSEEPVIEEPVVEEIEEPAAPSDYASESNEIPAGMKEEIKSVLSYMDQLLENLPEDKIAEFAQSEQFETYKKLFSELGLS